MVRGGRREEITYVEIEQAIDNLKNEKAPGMDSFAVEFYKRFKDQMVRRLIDSSLSMQPILLQYIPHTVPDNSPTPRSSFSGGCTKKEKIRKNTARIQACIFSYLY